MIHSRDAPIAADFTCSAGRESLRDPRGDVALAAPRNCAVPLRRRRHPAADHAAHPRDPRRDVETLAGYGGLISVGQQAFIGLGAYGTIFLTQHGFTPYVAMVVAGLSQERSPCRVVDHAALARRQFAIGMWVVAEVFGILVSLDRVSAAEQAYRSTVWTVPARIPSGVHILAGAGRATVVLGLGFVLLRRRIGASFQAIRDDEDAAASLGVTVVRSKRILFVLAAIGCGTAGALTWPTRCSSRPRRCSGCSGPPT